MSTYRSKQRCRKCLQYAGHNSRTCNRANTTQVVRVLAGKPATKSTTFIPFEPEHKSAPSTVADNFVEVEAENGFIPGTNDDDNDDIEDSEEGQELENSQLGQWTRKTAKWWNSRPPPQ